MRAPRSTWRRPRHPGKQRKKNKAAEVAKEEAEEALDEAKATFFKHFGAQAKAKMDSEPEGPDEPMYPAEPGFGAGRLDFEEENDPLGHMLQ